MRRGAEAAQRKKRCVQSVRIVGGELQRLQIEPLGLFVLLTLLEDARMRKHSVGPRSAQRRLARGAHGLIRVARRVRKGPWPGL